MPFIGFNFDRIHAERKVSEIKGDLNVKHNLNIIDLKTENITLEKKQEVLKFIFEFVLFYEPDIGFIKIEGHLLFLESPKKLKEMFQEWQKNKKISPEVLQNLFNTILAKTNIKALELSQDINLPPHLPLPRLGQQKKNINEYIG